MKQILINELKLKTTKELFDLAKTMNCIDEYTALNHFSLLIAIIKTFLQNKEIVYCEGTAEVLQDGYAFLRYPHENYLGSQFDIYVSARMVKKNNIRPGDKVLCTVGLQNKNDGFFPLDKIITINDKKIQRDNIRRTFESLTPTYPTRKINLGQSEDVSCKIIDILAPIGYGQRSLIVAPPKTGKTTIMKNIALTIEANNANDKLIVLLIDERPEEVTDMKESIKSPVFYSTFDEKPSNHVKVAEMVIETAKRMAEEGEDVIILFDSITRLARAYNAIAPSSGRVLSGGVEASALQKPKKFFGSARNTKEAGSLTIVATALVETGSKMDDVIFEEFKSTGNMELALSRAMFEKRIFPAISISKSGTRREELILDPNQINKIQVLKKLLSEMNEFDGINFLIQKMAVNKDNDTFFDRMGNNI